jgi:hypothetical protein
VPDLKGPVQGLTIDGKLDEPFWRAPSSNREKELGTCRGMPYHGASQCLVRSLPDRLLLALTVPSPGSTPLDLNMALLPGYRIPVKDSPYFIVKSEHGSPAEAHVQIKSVAVRYECDWELATATNSGVWTAEIAIPFSSVAKICPTLGLEPWRMNIIVSEPASGTVPGRVIAQWGFPELTEVTHGMKLTFQNPIAVSDSPGHATTKTH